MSRTLVSPQYLRLFAGIFLLALAACSSSLPHEKSDEDTQEDSRNGTDDGSFDVASIAQDSTLSEMRGGFVFAGGLKINFGLMSTTTIIDQVTQAVSKSTVNLSTDGLNGVTPQNLQQLIQAGAGNQTAVPASNVPINVLTVVQNTANNQVIQNQNVLDITVSNLAAFRNSQLAFTQRFILGPAR